MKPVIVYDGPSLPMIEYQGKLYALKKLVDGQWVSVDDEQEIEQLLEGDD